MLFNLLPLFKRTKRTKIKKVNSNRYQLKSNNIKKILHLSFPHNKKGYNNNKELKKRQTAIYLFKPKSTVERIVGGMEKAFNDVIFQPQ